MYIGISEWALSARVRLAGAMMTRETTPPPPLQLGTLCTRDCNISSVCVCVRVNCCLFDFHIFWSNYIFT
jgi:hypothetical protein